MKKIKYLGGALLLLLFFSQATYAAGKGLYLADPRVNDTKKAYRYVEVGAKCAVDIIYERTSADYKAISSAMLYLKFDPAKIKITGWDNHVLPNLVNNKNEITNNEIKLQFMIDTAMNVPLAINETTGLVKLATIKFLVLKNNQNNGADLDLKWNSDQKLVNVSVKEVKGGLLGAPTDYTKIDSVYNVKLEKGIVPQFAGLDKKPADPSIGNTLDLIWLENDKTANDKHGTGKAESLFGTALKLRYRLYRGKTTGFTKSGGDSLYYAPSVHQVRYRDGNQKGQIPNSKFPLYDGTKYYYRVVAYDQVYVSQTKLAPNEQAFSDVNEQSGIPTDTQAPSKPSLSLTRGNKKITLNISGLSADDKGGVVIVRSDKNLSATLDANINSARVVAGKYLHGDVIKEKDTLLGGTVIFAGWNMSDHGTTGKNVKPSGSIITSYVDDGDMTQTLKDGKLENGKTYYYRVIAYDRADGEYGNLSNPLKEMGRNYSAPSTERAIAPGVAPDGVQNLYAVSSPEGGNITLRWINPKDDANFEGVVFWASTSQKEKWGAIPNRIKDKSSQTESAWLAALGNKAKEMQLLGVYYRGATGKANMPASLTITKGLDGSKEYFIKAFAFNKITGTFPNDQAKMVKGSLSSFDFSDQAIAAALPSFSGSVVTGSGTGGGKGKIKLTINSNKNKSGKKNKFGINAIPIPGAVTTLKVGGKEAKTLLELVTNINAAIKAKSGKGKVTTVTYWDNSNQQPIGEVVKYDASGAISNKSVLTDSLLETVGGVSVYKAQSFYISIDDTGADVEIDWEK